MSTNHSFSSLVKDSLDCGQLKTLLRSQGPPVHSPPKSDEVGLRSSWVNFEHWLIETVYGSNLIEQAGTPDFAATRRLCCAVLRGDNAAVETEKETLGHQPVVEVSQHAEAFSYFIKDFVLLDKPLSEAMILDCHSILHRGLPVEDEVIAGRYRQHACSVRYGEGQKGKTAKPFIRWQAIPRYMEELVNDFNRETEPFEGATGLLHPYQLAARYCHRLVNIHPFADGNGRVCRMLLNVILLKHAGRFSVLGRSEREVEEYLGIAKRGGIAFYQEDMVVPEDQMTGHQELAEYIEAKSKYMFQRVVEGGMGLESS